MQQSLLPQSIPKLIGLDIAAHSRYCEQTGGDYYDFIDIADLPQDRAFIAVGDVMGHGIGSALVMATARAAVRASAQSGELSLGQLMGRVNDVLASDPHGLFMTLALIVIGCAIIVAVVIDQWSTRLTARRLARAAAITRVAA